MEILHYQMEAWEQFRCFQYEKNKTITLEQELEKQTKKNLLPSKKDDANIDELYWQSKYFCYLAGNCAENPHKLNYWWSKVNYYEVLEIIVFHTVYNINQI